jgi:hypothetical protein
MTNPISVVLVKTVMDKLECGWSGSIDNNTANITTSPGSNPCDPEAALASGSTPRSHGNKNGVQLILKLPRGFRVGHLF